MIVLHDIALAARYSDQIAVLRGGTLEAFGPPAAAITSGMLARVYDVDARVETCSKGTLQIVVDCAL